MVWLILIFMINVGQIPYMDGMGKVNIDWDPPPPSKTAGNHDYNNDPLPKK